MILIQQLISMFRLDYVMGMLRFAILSRGIMPSKQIESEPDDFVILATGATGISHHVLKNKPIIKIQETSNNFNKNEILMQELKNVLKRRNVNNEWVHLK